MRVLANALCAGGVIFLLLFQGTAAAFYNADGGISSINLRGVLAGGAGYADYPDDNFIYAETDDVLWNADLRLLGELSVGQQYKADVNFLQNVRSAQAGVIPGTRTAQREVERSSLFFWNQLDADNSQASFTLDSGKFAFGNVSNELVVGRQPVNLSVTFYFTPNDFFAPFAPQNFYREFKPGVDALRYERRLADLTQLTLLAVLGYSVDPDSESGWSKGPDWQRTSFLGRITHIVGMYELGFLGGMLADYSVIGASLQGDIFDWLGLRAECNYQDTWRDYLTDGFQVSLGLEHHFSSRLVGRVEQMFNGQGYASISDADKALSTNSLRSGFLGRSYSAIAASYEFSPLMTGDVLFLHNWTDGSQSYSLHGLYSVSDESELAMTLNFSPSKDPDRQSLRSEFGMIPTTLTLEYRLYF